MDEYNIPKDVTALFKNEAQTYHIYDSDIDMDNIQAMYYFFECVDIPSENVVVWDGTQVFVKHDKFPYHICIDSYGHGTFSRNGYDITRVKPDGSGGDYIT